VKRSRIRVH